MSEPHFMPHQIQALNKTESFNRCAYYLDMGLGKTFVGAEKMWRLMGISDEDYNKASKVVSSTQLYKEAGNAIVVDALKAIFSQMNIKGVEAWNERNKDE